MDHDIIDGIDAGAGCAWGGDEAVELLSSEGGGERFAMCVSDTLDRARGSRFEGEEGNTDENQCEEYLDERKCAARAYC
jgi:hypothetical protein